MNSTSSPRKSSRKCGNGVPSAPSPTFVNRDPDAGREISQTQGSPPGSPPIGPSTIPRQPQRGGIATQPAGSLFQGCHQWRIPIRRATPATCCKATSCKTSPRSSRSAPDYFRICSMGEATDAQGKVIARQFCEAFVQRVPEYLDPSDLPEIMADDLNSEVNRLLGRRFQLVSFRWLASDEI